MSCFFIIKVENGGFDPSKSIKLFWSILFEGQIHAYPILDIDIFINFRNAFFARVMLDQFNSI